ncbi:MAG: hypothetical protein ABR555_04195 [Pyrinomonadaceae bacterium]
MRKSLANVLCGFIVCNLLTVCAFGVQTGRQADDEFGPVVRAYLGYLKNEQEVVDDRVSRREISATYYRRNSNRIRALRQTAIRLARESNNDYLPELEAVAPREFGILFEQPPQPSTLKLGQVLRNTFRFLGTVRSGEVFYIFERLDPYEQADLKEKESQSNKTSGPSVQVNEAKTLTRARRVGP